MTPPISKCGVSHPACCSGPQKSFGRLITIGLGRAAHNNPDASAVSGAVDLHVWQPRRDVDEIAWLGSSGELAVLAPADETMPFEHIGDGLLLSVMMDASFRVGLDDDDAAPNPGLAGDCGKPLGSRSLGGLAAEKSGLHDANGLISIHDD